MEAEITAAAQEIMDYIASCDAKVNIEEEAIYTLLNHYFGC